MAHCARVPTAVSYWIEHVARELDVACAIRAILRRERALDAPVRSLAYEDLASLAAPGPRVVVVPFLASAQDFGVRELLQRWPESHFVNLAFEQFFFAVSRRYKGARDETARRGALHLAASREFADFLIACGVPEAQIELVGSLACALVTPPYRCYFEGQRERLAEECGLDPGRPWVFFPENYSAAFLSETGIQNRIRQGADPEEARTYRDFARAGLRGVMPWCAEAARRAGAELVIRPRPGTPRASFVAAFEAAAGKAPERLHILKQGTVREWMLASEVVVSSYSTTMIEAAVAGKPIFALEPFAAPPELRFDWQRLVPRIRSADELVSLCGAPESAKDSGELGDWARAQLLGFGDPIAQTAALIADVAGGLRAAPLPPDREPEAQQRGQPLGASRRWIARIAARRRRRVIAERNAHHYEADRFEAAEVELRTARWTAVLGGPARSEPAASPSPRDSSR
jgi:hypothetical protein